MSVLAGGLLIAPLGTDAQAAEFVGSESCRSCHEVAYEQWKKGPHARSFVSLTPAQQKDQRCIQCHAPDLPSGGEPAVSCESCHGAGEYYWPEHVMRDAELARATGLVTPTAQSCLLCHDASSPAVTPFDAAAKMKVIDHWTKDRELRTQAATSSEKASGDKASCDRVHAVRRAPIPEKPTDTFLARALREDRRQGAGQGKADDGSAVALATANPASSRPAAPPRERD